MQEKAFYSIPTGPVVTQHLMEGTTNPELLMKQAREGFEIVYMPDQFAAAMPSSILTEGGGKTMRIATTFKSKEWLGIMLAHEMSHVYDQLIEGENSRDENQYLAGEVKAHLFEMKLLKSWNPQAYEKLISAGIPMIRSGNRNGVMNLARSLYPLEPGQVSQNEASLGSASCLVAVYFEDAMQRGATPEQLKGVYVNLTRQFGR